MSVTKKPLSRRAFLRGANGLLVGLPFLEAMLPSRASAASLTPRLVSIYGGVPTYFNRQTLPTGALDATLIPSVSSLASVRQHVSVLTNMSLPVYNKGTTAPPGGCVNQQHYTAPAPLLAGVTSQEGKPMLNGCHTVDQVFADVYGTSTRFKSIQARVQAAGYGYGQIGGIVSSRYKNGVLSALAPIESPVQLYAKLFSSGVTSGGPTSVVSAQVLNRRSVLDLILGDANRLIGSLGGTDKARMEQHFDEIRQIEKNLSASAPPIVAGGGCAIPSRPPADPAISDVMGGWGAETVRGDLMADILAMALACDLTRAVSWQLTFDQCGLGSLNITGVNKDLHQISHDVNNDSSLGPAMASHLNWHCARFARLVQKLAALPEGNGSVLDNTFIGMGFGEGTSAHGRSSLHMFIAGNSSKVKLGQCIAANGEHPARMWVAGLNSLGMNTNTLGEITGPMTTILK